MKKNFQQSHKKTKFSSSNLLCHMFAWDINLKLPETRKYEVLTLIYIKSRKKIQKSRTEGTFHKLPFFEKVLIKKFLHVSQMKAKYGLKLIFSFLLSYPWKNAKKYKIIDSVTMTTKFKMAIFQTKLPVGWSAKFSPSSFSRFIESFHNHLNSQRNQYSHLTHWVRKG